MIAAGRMPRNAEEWKLFGIIMVVLAVVFGAWWLVSLYRANRRSKALQEAAEGMGFAFEHSGDPAVLEHLLSVLRPARQLEEYIDNHLRGVVDGVPIDIFDRRMNLGPAANNVESTESFGRVRCEGKSLPRFKLTSAAGFFDKLLGDKQISLPLPAPFDKQYALECDDAEAAQNVFTEGLLLELDHQKIDYVYGSGDWVFVNFAGKVKAADLPQFIAKVKLAAEAFKKHT